MTAADRVEEIRALYTSDGLTFAFGWRDAIRDLLTALDTERERAEAAQNWRKEASDEIVRLTKAAVAENDRVLTAERERDAAREALRKALRMGVHDDACLWTPPMSEDDRVECTCWVKEARELLAALAPGNAPVEGERVRVGVGTSGDVASEVIRILLDEPPGSDMALPITIDRPPNREEIQGEVGMEVLPEEAPTAPAEPSEAMRVRPAPSALAKEIAQAVQDIARAVNMEHSSEWMAWERGKLEDLIDRLAGRVKP